jgi:Lrp/AsnC family leucine-responsive transcriptional regulator
METKLDQIDKKILNILQGNAKITNSQLAIEVGLSPAPTLERVKKLENAGVIKSYHAELDQEMMGLGVCVFIQASLQGSNKNLMESFQRKIQKIPEVVECYHITGTSDFLLKILSKDIKTYNDFILDRLIEISEIGNLQSMVVLSTIKNAKKLPVF